MRSHPFDAGSDEQAALDAERLAFAKQQIAYEEQLYALREMNHWLAAGSVFPTLLAPLRGGPFLDEASVPSCGGVYYVEMDGPAGKAIKIGWSKRNIGRRLAQLRTSAPWPLKLLAFEKDRTTTRERELHDIFCLDRIRKNGEWFRPSEALMRHIQNLRWEAKEAA